MGAARTADTETRYDFGRNWSDLTARLEERHVLEASKDLARLTGDLDGKTFLDIGCGSGLHAAAACRLGARKVVAIDYDPQSVATARTVLDRFAGGPNWQVGQADATDMSSLPADSFDIVYSWGVLHHTGNMEKAVRNAAALVAPGGRLCMALYLKTPLCGFWRVEKRIYSRNKWLRPVIKAPFVAALLLARTLRQGDPVSFVKNYRQRRGMEFLVDVDDWLGGFPYESLLPEDLEAMVGRLGFQATARFNVRPGLGILGTGCGEWRFERMT